MITVEVKNELTYSPHMSLLCGGGKCYLYLYHYYGYFCYYCYNGYHVYHCSCFLQLRECARNVLPCGRLLSC